MKIDMVVNYFYEKSSICYVNIRDIYIRVYIAPTFEYSLA